MLEPPGDGVGAEKSGLSTRQRFPAQMPLIDLIHVGLRHSAGEAAGLRVACGFLAPGVLTTQNCCSNKLLECILNSEEMHLSQRVLRFPGDGPYGSRGLVLGSVQTSLRKSRRKLPYTVPGGSLKSRQLQWGRGGGHASLRGADGGDRLLLRLGAGGRAGGFEEQ